MGIWSEDLYNWTVAYSYCKIYRDGGDPNVYECTPYALDGDGNPIVPPPSTGLPPPVVVPPIDPDNSVYPIIAWVDPVGSSGIPGVHLELGMCVGYDAVVSEWEVISDGVSLEILSLTVSHTGIYMFEVAGGITQGVSVVTLSHLEAASGIQMFIDGVVLNEI